MSENISETPFSAGVEGPEVGDIGTFPGSGVGGITAEKAQAHHLAHHAVGPEVAVRLEQDPTKGYSIELE